MTPEQERRITDALKAELLQEQISEQQKRIVFVVETFFISNPDWCLNHQMINGGVDKQGRVFVEIPK